MTSAPLYFEDFAPGQSYRSSAAIMERDRIVAFGQEFDPQPQHVSEEGAKGSMFGSLVASGWHTGSLTMRLQLEAVMDRMPGGAMGAQVDSLAWRRPVLPGDALYAVVEVLECRPSRSRPERGVLQLKTTTYNQRDEAVMEMTAAVLVPRRTPG